MMLKACAVHMLSLMSHTPEIRPLGDAMSEPREGVRMAEEIAIEASAGIISLASKYIIFSVVAIALVQ